ncbi:hypothetical protein CBL_20115 [Carabus blaptoides fortunei]
MIKLVRNTFGDKAVLTYKNKEIKFKHITTLFDIEQEEGLRAGTKLTVRHIQYRKQIMNVRLAVQLLSDSEDVNPTAEFIQNMNDVFDILNSRWKYSKSDGIGPIREETLEKYGKISSKICSYIKELKLIDGVAVTESNRYTGIVGLLICCENIFKLYKVLRDKHQLNYLLTYKLSQDHLEMFFSAVRGRGGFNNNPTSVQFQAAYKRLLVYTAVKGSDCGNLHRITS